MAGRLTTVAICLALPAVVAAQSRPMIVPPGIQQRRLIHAVRPVYPKLAKEARIQGTVRLAVLIGEDGIIDRLRWISGHPNLVKAAFDAVKQWRYRPATRDGAPVRVVTTVEVSFTMGEPPPPHFTV